MKTSSDLIQIPFRQVFVISSKAFLLDFHLKHLPRTLIMVICIYFHFTDRFPMKTSSDLIQIPFRRVFVISSTSWFTMAFL